MATPRFKTKSEKAYANHLTLAGLTYQYEKAWGDAYPDFTIQRPGLPATTVAIADVKDMHFSDADEARLALATEEMIDIERNPAEKTRQQIFLVWRQFAACADYPCILVLAPGGDWLPDPTTAMAAMLGDYTIRVGVSTSPDVNVEFVPAFGENGKMVGSDGNAKNTRITAIGLLSTICPGAVSAGFREKAEALAPQYLTEDGGEEAANRYLAACNQLETSLAAEGYDMKTLATQVEYVVNPLAVTPFPKADLARGCVKVWEYDLATRRFGLTYDWSTLSRPR